MDLTWMTTALSDKIRQRNEIIKNKNYRTGY